MVHYLTCPTDGGLYHESKRASGSGPPEAVALVEMGEYFLYTTLRKSASPAMKAVCQRIARTDAIFFVFRVARFWKSCYCGRGLPPVVKENGYAAFADRG